MYLTVDTLAVAHISFDTTASSLIAGIVKTAVVYGGFTTALDRFPA